MDKYLQKNCVHTLKHKKCFPIYLKMYGRCIIILYVASLLISKLYLKQRYLIGSNIKKSLSAHGQIDTQTQMDSVGYFMNIYASVTFITSIFLGFGKSVVQTLLNISKLLQNSLNDPFSLF